MVWKRSLTSKGLKNAIIKMLDGCW